MRKADCGVFKPVLRRMALSVSLTNVMSTLQEIKAAIAHLDPRERALLTAELFAMEPEPDAAELEAALERGLQDVEAGRVRPIEDVRGLMSAWISKS